MRGIAILAVMALHFVNNMIHTPESFVERAFHKATSYGSWGVDLFFVLSGFLITGILHDTKGGERYFRSFYMRRTLRIFPLYYGVLVLLMILIPEGLLTSYAPGVLEARREQAWLWPYLTNVRVAIAGGFSLPYVSHFWTLAIEEHFYLVWPLAVAYLSRQSAMRLCIGLGVFSLLLRIVLGAMHVNAIATQVLTPCRLDTLCTGAWLALAARDPSGDASLVARIRRFIGYAAAALLGLSVFHATTDILTEPVLAVRGTVLSLFFGAFILLAARDERLVTLRRLLTMRWLTTMGKYSYGLYVFHGIVAHFMASHETMSRLAAAVGSRLVALAGVALGGTLISVGLAVASYELFEVRFLRLKKRFEARRPAEARVTSEAPAVGTAPP